MLSETVDLAERLSKMLDIFGLTTIHNTVTDFLKLMGLGHEAADVATWMILIFLGLAGLGYLFNPTDDQSKK